MSENTDISKNTDPLEYVRALDGNAAINILLKLCREDGLTDRIVEMAKTSLSGADADEIADSVFRDLNSIQIEDLWENSGESYWGYRDITEVAYDMVGEAIDHYRKEMKQYKTLGMKKEEKEYCKGIISGLLKYGEAGSNEFHDAAPDDPYTYVEDLIYDWKKDNTAEDIEEVQAVHDSYFSDDDSVNDLGGGTESFTQSDFEEFERKQNEIRDINNTHLANFKKWLRKNGLSERTISGHLKNVEFYINEYLCYYDALGVEHGCYSIGRFLGDWLIRKTPASCTGIKSYAASIKKFYALMAKLKVIEKKDYDNMCATIKDELPEWLDAMRRYEEELEDDDWF